jgi:hypothetical protein
MNYDMRFEVDNNTGLYTATLVGSGDLCWFPGDVVFQNVRHVSSRYWNGGSEWTYSGDRFLAGHVSQWCDPVWDVDQTITVTTGPVACAPGNTLTEFWGTYTRL